MADTAPPAERPLLASFKRVADRKLAMRFGAISGTSLLVAVLDAIGLLLLVPLVVFVASPLPALIGIAYFGLASVLYMRVVQQKVRDRARGSELSSAAAVKVVQERMAACVCTGFGPAKPNSLPNITVIESAQRLASAS